MRKSVSLVAAGVALVGMGVATGWAVGAAGHPSPAPTEVQTATTGVASATSPEFTGQLVAFDSCSALLDALHARARDVVGPYGLSSAVNRYGLLYGQKSASASLAPGTAIPQASAGGSTSAGAPDSGALTHSTTNTQVAGVDEPDIVKTDGRYLVSLDGQLLHIVDVRTSKLRATLALPQPGSELLLAGDHVVVLSGPSVGSGVYPVASGVAGAEYGPAQSYPSYGASTSTLATVIDLSSPDAPKVTHRWSFSAGEIAARVVNGTIRLVLSSPPPQEAWTHPRTDTSAEKSRATKVNQQIVDATPLDAWVPRWTGDDGQSHPLSTCTAVAAPAKPASLSMVTVVSLDPGANQPGAGTSVLGGGSVAYAEGQHLFVSDTGTYPTAQAGALPADHEPDDPPARVRHLRPGAGPLPRLRQRARAAARLLRAVGVPGPPAGHHDDEQ